MEWLWAEEQGLHMAPLLQLSKLNRPIHAYGKRRLHGVVVTHGAPELSQVVCARAKSLASTRVQCTSADEERRKQS